MRRKVIQEDLCESCREAPETVGHVLWSCPKAKEAWECSKLAIGGFDGQNLTFQDLMWELLLNGEAGEDKVAHAATTAWALWHNRNEIRCGGARKSGQQLSRWATDYLREYNAAAEVKIPRESVPRQVAFWSPPRNGHFKINVDGAVFAAQKAVGVGVVIRDDEGRLEAALCRKITAPMGAVEAEAKAFEAGLLFAKAVGVRDIILEGDSLVVYNALCNISSPPSSIASIVQGIVDMSGEFRSVSYSHIRRQGNVPAHILAKHASGITNYIAWIEEDPCCIAQALSHDVTSIPI
nr:uncharacterized protein LOC111993063 [Quercus suber]